MKKLLIASAVVWVGLLGWGALEARAAEGPEAARDRALKLFRRLTGVSLPLSDPRVAQLQQMAQEGRYEDVAAMAIEDSRFYLGTLRNFAAVMSTQEETPSSVFNDFQAMVLGVARDGIDARQLLAGNFTYVIDAQGLPAASPGSNEHYKAAELRNVDLKAALRKVEPQREGAWEPAGVLTSRAWGEAHLEGGTNRRAIEFTMREFLCVTKDQWKDHGVPDTFVRRDVSRAPGENPAEYQNRCRSCHGIMDGLSGTFARYDFRAGSLIYLGPNAVASKLNQHPEVYPEGWVVTDDSWVNFATRNQNQALGWRGPLQGRGIREFGEMVAAANGFGRCMVKRAYREVCKRDLETIEGGGMIQDRLTAQFEAGGFKLNQLFQKVAVQPGCVLEAL